MHIRVEKINCLTGRAAHGEIEARRAGSRVERDYDTFLCAPPGKRKLLGGYE
jgi:hypothetical protein